MFHFVRFITWLLLFLQLSNQLADPNEKLEKDLVKLAPRYYHKVPRYYQRTILHGLIQSQATTGDNIDPKMVYVFLKKSDVILDNRISDGTFQEIYDKLKDSLSNPLIDPLRSIDLSEYETSQDEFKQKYVQEIGKGASEITYKTLVQHLVTLYNEYCSLVKNTSKSIDSILNSLKNGVAWKGGKEPSMEEKREVSLTSELIATSKIQSDYRLGTDSLKQFLSDYVRTIPEPEELFYFTIKAMQSVDSSVNIDQSFSDYLVKLGLFDKTFNPAVNQNQTAWDWANVTASFYEIPSELSLYYEGRYSTFPKEGVPGTMPLSFIVQEWTQAYRRYQKEKLHLDDEEEFKFQRQTEFFCGFVVAFTHLNNLGASLSANKSSVEKCTSWACNLWTNLGPLVDIPLTLFIFKDNFLNLVFPTGTGSMPANPNTTRPPTSPPLRGRSSTFWWIVSIGVVTALLGCIYWNYSNRSDDDDESSEREEVPKKDKPKVKKKAKKKKPKVKVKNRVLKSKILPASSSAPVSPSSVSLVASPSTLTSQAGTKSVATQSPSSKAWANKAKRYTARNKAKEKLVPDVTNIMQCTTLVFPALVAPRNEAPTLPASTLPLTSTRALTRTLTRTPTWETPTRQRTPALPSNVTASQQTQTPTVSSTHQTISNGLNALKR